MMKLWESSSPKKIGIDEKIYPTSGKNKSKLPYDFESDSIVTLDLECTNAYLTKEGEVIPYMKGKSEKFWGELTPISIPYICMIQVDDERYYMRNLEELPEFLKQFDSNTHYIIWIHNLAYDFVQLQNVLDFEIVFAREERHPMKAIPKNFQNIEFRCSYTLTRLKLETWGKELGFPKMVGDLEYNKIRTPLTELTQKELGYCERDIEVQAEGIKKYLSKYNHIKDIPLTQTGEVRREVKKRVLQNKALQRKLVKMLPEDARMYHIMKKAFQGGYTHANEIFVGHTVENGCAYDFASSYPAVMCSEKFPMEKFLPDVWNPAEVEEKAFLLKVRLEGVKSKCFNHYLSSSKCNKLVTSKDFSIDNGRIIQADLIETWITEQDYLILKKTYSVKRMKVLECFSAKKDYLPKEIVEYILELYALKTMLKDVPGKEEIYAQAKQFINSLFGMCVTDFICDVILYSGDGWKTEEKQVQEVEDYLNELKTVNKGRTFLAYQWGLWITAYARKNLWDCLLTCDRDVVYCDTDSLKIRGEKDFSWYNKKITEKLRKCCEHYNLDFEMTHPKTPKGKEKPLGIFEREKDWSEFKTLGAKRYCYRERPKKDKNDVYGGDGLLHLTVSGINKDAVLVLDDNIENFNEDTIFDKDFQLTNGELKEHPTLGKYYDETESDGYVRGVHKSLLSYNDNQPTVKFEDGYVSNFKHGVCIRPTSYSMGMAEEFEMLINSLGCVRDHLLCI